MQGETTQIAGSQPSGSPRCTLRHEQPAQATRRQSLSLSHGVGAAADTEEGGRVAVLALALALAVPPCFSALGSEQPLDARAHETRMAES